MSALLGNPNTESKRAETSAQMRKVTIKSFVIAASPTDGTDGDVGSLISFSETRRQSRKKVLGLECLVVKVVSPWSLVNEHLLSRSR